MSEEKKKMDYKTVDPETLRIFSDKLESNNDRLEEKYTKERDVWSKELYSIVSKLAIQDKNNMLDIQTEALSLKHILEDKLYDIRMVEKKLKPKLYTFEADRNEYYETNYKIKYNSPTKTACIKRDLGQRNRKMEMVKVYIEFLEKSRNMCESFLYTIKERITMFQHLL